MARWYNKPKRSKIKNRKLYIRKLRSWENHFFRRVMKFIYNPRPLYSGIFRTQYVRDEKLVELYKGKENEINSSDVGDDSKRGIENKTPEVI